MQPRVPLLLLAALVAGCSSAPEVREQNAPAPVQPSTEMIQGAQIARYVQAMQTMVQGAASEKAEVLDKARRDYDGAKRGPAVLLYALVLAAPGHEHRDPALAQRLLSEALANRELLTIPERNLAEVELQRVNEELRLIAEKDRLVAEARLTAEKLRNTATNPAQTNQLRAANEENAKLRKALDEARTKLEAIAELEKRLSERQPPTEGRKP